MGDRENAAPNNQQGQNNPPAPLPPVPAPPAPNPNQPHGENIHQAAPGNPDPPEHWFTDSDWWMVILTGLALIVGIATLRIFYRQFQEMQTQTKQAASDSAEAANKVERQLALAKQQNDIAIAANRPWIGVVPAPETDKTSHHIEAMKDESGQPFTAFMYLWHLKNAGHRPARMEQILTTGQTFANKCGNSPTFDRTIANVTTLPFSPKRTSKALIIPDTQIKSLFGWSIPWDEWQKIANGKASWCIYIAVEYRDVDYPSMLHHTRDCRLFVAFANDMVNCDNDYFYAD